MPRIDRLTEMTEADRKAIIAPLVAFNRKLGFDSNKQPLTLVLRDDEGAIVGGLIGACKWEWLYTEILAVTDDLRSQGWGRRLMEEAERLAIAAGCRYAWVETLSFQARPFYEKLGYRVFGELPDHPAGQTRFFLAKPLTTSPSPLKGRGTG